MLTWMKPSGFPVFNRWRFNSEHVVFGVAAPLPLLRPAISVAFEAPNRGHSVKPDEFYEYKTMSGVLPGRHIAALRLNSSVVKWYEKAGGLRKDKLPVAGGDKYVGLVMLFSTETGEPLAIFPDGLQILLSRRVV